MTTISEIKSRIESTASAYGVPPNIALAVARRESDFSQDARGAAGEVGIFQLMPGTAKELQVDPYDVEQNIQGGISYLAKMFNQFGDWALALAAYNAGPGRVKSGSIPESTQQYVIGVLASAGTKASMESPFFSYGSNELGTAFDSEKWFPLGALVLGGLLLWWYYTD